MRAFYASIILLILVVATVLINSIYINNTTEAIKNLALDVCEAESSREVKLENLKSYWEKHKRIMCLSVSFKDVNEITEYVIRFSCAVESNDISELRRSFELLKNSLDDIAKYERIYFHTIF